MRRKHSHYQYGNLERCRRKRGPDVWVYRWREYSPEGEAYRRGCMVGTVEQFRSAGSALKAAEQLRHRANNQTKTLGEVAFGTLIERYCSEEMPERHSTKKSYVTMLNRHIRPAWADVRLSQVKPMLVQRWFSRMNVAPKYKSKIKALMHRLFEKAMLWELIPVERNPMALVEIKGGSRRRKKPIVLTMEQYCAVLALLPEPYRTMVVVAQCLGLRVSEILALRWEDIDFADFTMRVTRAVVDGIVDDVKTEYSEDDLPLDRDLATVLPNWRKQSLQPAEGWVFPSPITGGCYHASPIQQDYIRSAGRKLGLGDIGWHTFRHTYRSWLDAVGTPIGVQQKLMRHAQVATTMNVYGNALMESKREANTKIVRLALHQMLDEKQKRPQAQP